VESRIRGLTDRELVRGEIPIEGNYISMLLIPQGHPSHNMVAQRRHTGPRERETLLSPSNTMEYITGRKKLPDRSASFSARLPSSSRLADEVSAIDGH